MKPPKCFICERYHWASEDCPDEGIHKEDVVKGSGEVLQGSSREGEDVSSETSTQVERNRKYRKKNPEKYREYMRRYMRRYRAK